MTLIRHELRRGWKSLLIWTCSISAFIVICLLIFPEMKSQMDSISTVFASMGAFTKAFGMESLNFGTLTGYYGVECGNILGIGGALFAALLGVSALAREEKDGTAELLLTHPLSRARVVTEKQRGRVPAGRRFHRRHRGSGPVEGALPPAPCLLPPAG